MSKEVYVEGLPYDMQDSQVTELFADCGPIVRSVIPRWNDSGRLRGYAILEFQDVAGAEKALALNRKEVGSRFITVSLSTGKKTPGTSEKTAEITADEQATCKTLFVGNLPYDATEDEINGVFSAYGPMQEIRVVTENGRAKGFAYLEYKKPGIVRRIVTDQREKKKQFVLKQRELNVDYNTGKKKAGFHMRKEAFESNHYSKKQSQEDKRKNIVKKTTSDFKRSRK